MKLKDRRVGLWEPLYIDFNKTVLFRAKRPIAIELSAVILRQAGFPRVVKYHRTPRE